MLCSQGDQRNIPIVLYHYELTKVVDHDRPFILKVELLTATLLPVDLSELVGEQVAEKEGCRRERHDKFVLVEVNFCYVVPPPRCNFEAR